MSVHQIALIIIISIIYTNEYKIVSSCTRTTLYKLFGAFEYLRHYEN